MANVKIGIIGIGNMGSSHAVYLNNREIEGAELTAVCDSNPDRLQWAKETWPIHTRKYDFALNKKGYSVTCL